MISICKGCDQSFMAFRTDVMYCSEVCRTQTRRNKKNDRVGLVRNCAYCKAEFTTHTRNQLYCDIPCRTKMHRSKQRAFRTGAPRALSSPKTQLDTQYYTLMEEGLMAACNKEWRKCYKLSRNAFNIADTDTRKVDSQYWYLYASVQIGKVVPEETIIKAIDVANGIMGIDGRNDHSSTVKRLECLVGQARYV